MRLCICDDDISVHNEIKHLLKQILNTELHYNVTSIFSGEDLLDFYSNKNSFDLVFLDIEMKKLNGLHVAEKIKEMFPNTIIIFVSSYPNYVFDVFRLEALHFILKPIKPDEFTDVLHRAMNKYRSLKSSITLKWQNDRFNIIINEIIYIEGYKRHLTVYTTNEKFESLGKISEMIEILEPYGFVRIHQGFIVNMDYIKKFEATDVILRDNTRVMVSVRKRTNALKAYDHFIQNRKW